ncbi:MAG: helix-turn-helix domain-containing protein [Actinomycetota bacterium]|nr:helix-turn-helix domain-containing protein [Actinomycetota bacterium]
MDVAHRLAIQSPSTPKPEAHSFESMHIRLLATALEVMNEVGYDNATVGAIASRAFVSRSTLYRHFENKSDMLQQILQWHQKSVFESCLKLTRIRPGDKEALSGWLEDFPGLYEWPSDAIIDSHVSGDRLINRIHDSRRAAESVIRAWERSGWTTTSATPVEHILLLFQLMTHWCRYRLAFGTERANLSREALLDIVSRELASVFVPSR